MSGRTWLARCWRAGIRSSIVDDFNDFYDPSIKAAKRRGLLAGHVRIIEADIRDASCIDARCFPRDGFAAIVHIAARAGIRPSIAATTTLHGGQCAGDPESPGTNPVSSA